MKLLGRITVLISLYISVVFSADAFISNTKVVQGDKVVLTLRASGKQVEFPDINSIDGHEVVATSQQQNIQNINGKVTRSVRKEYHFYPSSNVKIPSYIIKVDGKIEKTDPISINLSKDEVLNDSFSLQMQVNNKEPYLNEAVELVFVFKMKKEIEVVDLRFTPPSFSNFWVKEGKKSQPIEENGYVIQKISYLLFPQKVGKIELPVARLDVGLAQIGRDVFNMLTRSINWKRVYSNRVSLNVKQLQNTQYIGDFKISLSVDKKELQANKSVNGILKIEGYGNFDDIEELAVDTTAAMFRDKAKVKSSISDSKLVGIYEQKISFSSDEDFVIEPIEFTFFSQKENILKTIKTDKVKINVMSVKQEDDIYLQSRQNSNNKEKNLAKKSSYDIYIGFLLGVAFCFIIWLVITYRKNFKYKKIESEKKLLKKLLLINNKEAKQYIKEIENYLYVGKKFPLNKKEIERFIKSYEE